MLVHHRYVLVYIFARFPSCGGNFTPTRTYMYQPSEQQDETTGDGVGET
jgi:hypothetical protein